MNSIIKKLRGDRKRANEYVFPSPKTNGKLNNIKRSFQRALQTAEIKDFCFQDLRHTGATRMADKGTDGSPLMKIFRTLGYSDDCALYPYYGCGN